MPTQIITHNDVPPSENLSSSLSLKPRIRALLAQIGAGMHEREQILAVALLGAISGQNTFLFGPPGTAKSLISRRLSLAFSEQHYFECLMNRFTTPEEIFGPVSIKALKEDRYIRQIEGYLPTANFAFLDEIWKSSPAILNNLLTIINEGLFKNGNDSIKVPLKSLIAASNEVPEENQGLEALYDRFILRMLVPPIQEEANFDLLLQSQPSQESIKISRHLVISQNELIKWREEINHITLSNDSLDIIKNIRKQINEQNKDINIYVSDRRWQRAAQFIKASAFCNDRQETNQTDLLLLKYCLWTTPENRSAIENIVEECINKTFVNPNMEQQKLRDKKEKLEKEIYKKCCYLEDIYDTTTLANGAEYFKVNAVFNYDKEHFYDIHTHIKSELDKKYRYTSPEKQKLEMRLQQAFFNRSVEELEEIKREILGGTRDNRKTEFELYIPKSLLTSKTPIYAQDKYGNLLQSVECKAQLQQISITYHYGQFSKSHYVTNYNLLHSKGDRKVDLEPSIRKNIQRKLENLKLEYLTALNEVEKKITNNENEFSSPFVYQKDTLEFIDGFKRIQNNLAQEIRDFERLEQLC